MVLTYKILTDRQILSSFAVKKYMKLQDVLRP